MVKFLIRSAAFAAVSIAPFAALAQTYAPGPLPAFNVPPGQTASVSIGDTFSAANGLVAPANPLQPYNFADLYCFTTNPGTAQVDTITFSYASGLSNIQIALFSGQPTGFAAPGTYNNSVGSTSGAVAGGGWGADQYTSVGAANIVSLADVALNPGGLYTLEIRGDAPSLTGVQTASYSGNLAITSPVPESGSAAMMLAGMALMVSVARRTRQR